MLISFKNRKVGPMADAAQSHPRWHRSIVRSLHAVFPLVCEADGNSKEELQLFLSMHSPLVMSALEDEFASSDAEHDKWFDFDTNMSTRKVDIAECCLIVNAGLNFVDNLNRRYT